MWDVVDAMIELIWWRHERRVLAKELLRLNDHLLADIGLRRDQVGNGFGPIEDEPPRVPFRRSAVTHGRVNPSLQGCG